MEKRGIDFLYPIWHLIERKPQELITQQKKGLGLTSNDIKVFYTAYINDFKRQIQPNEYSIRTAIDEKLTPGKFLVLFRYSKDG